MELGKEVSAEGALHSRYKGPGTGRCSPNGVRTLTLSMAAIAIFVRSTRTLYERPSRPRPVNKASGGSSNPHLRLPPGLACTCLPALHNAVPRSPWSQEVM